MKLWELITSLSHMVHWGLELVMHLHPSCDLALTLDYLLSTDLVLYKVDSISRVICNNNDTNKEFIAIVQAETSSSPNIHSNWIIKEALKMISMQLVILTSSLIYLSIFLPQIVISYFYAVITKTKNISKRLLFYLFVLGSKKIWRFSIISPISMWLFMMIIGS